MKSAYHVTREGEVELSKQGKASCSDIMTASAHSMVYACYV